MALGGFARPFCILHSAFCLSRKWLCPAFRGSRSEVQGSMFDRLHPPGDRARLPNHLYFFGFSALQQSELFAGCDEVLRFLLFCLPISMSLDLFRISDFRLCRAAFSVVQQLLGPGGERWLAGSSKQTARLAGSFSTRSRSSGGRTGTKLLPECVH